MEEAEHLINSGWKFVGMLSTNKIILCIDAKEIDSKSHLVKLPSLN